MHLRRANRAPPAPSYERAALPLPLCPLPQVSALFYVPGVSASAPTWANTLATAFQADVQSMTRMGSATIGTPLDCSSNPASTLLGQATPCLMSDGTTTDSTAVYVQVDIADPEYSPRTVYTLNKISDAKDAKARAGAFSSLFASTLTVSAAPVSPFYVLDSAVAFEAGETKSKVRKAMLLLGARESGEPVPHMSYQVPP